MSLYLSHLKYLEAESIAIIRDVASECEKPVLLYSVGKDSSVLLRLIQKAFHPGRVPFPALHVDTGYKFRDMYRFRDDVARQLSLDLIVFRNENAIASGASPVQLGTFKCCQLLKTQALLLALKNYGFTAALGGARRDEEKSRAKERVFSFRDQYGQWDPRNQRPELWSLYNSRIAPQESMRVFPLSNWTELDVWQYIKEEEIPIVPLYFAKKRRVLRRNNQLIPAEGILNESDKDDLEDVVCRFRTLGCSPCTGVVESDADTIDKIIAEVGRTNLSERSTRVIDHDTDGSMEQKKREGYF